MSQTENHWNEVAQIKIELMRHMIALGLDWHDEFVMKQLAAECKVYAPANAQAAYITHDQKLITKAELFGLVSVMLCTMENAAHDDRDVHGGEVWKTFSKHFYS